jgi:hypothetical protein
MILVLKCLLTFVYDPHYKNLCAEFWNATDNFGASYNDPWVCIGDFNAIILPDDKLGGRPFDSYSSNPFIDFMDGYEMIDLGFCENPYLVQSQTGLQFD